MTAIETSVENWFSTTLSGSVNAGDTTFPVASISSLTSPCYIVIDPESATKREVIYCDGTFGGSSFVTSTTGNRGLAGSAAGAQAHDSGTPVVVTPLAQHLADIHDRVDATNTNVSTNTSNISTNATDIANIEDGTTDLSAFVDHGSLAGLADFTADHGTQHDAHDHSTALGTAALSDLGSLDAGSNKITSVTDPTAAQDAATKAYVDSEISGITAPDVPTRVYKTADETVTGSATLQDDDHLLFSMAANTTYAVKMFLLFECTGLNNNRLDFDIQLPSGATVAGSANTINDIGGDGGAWIDGSEVQTGIDEEEAVWVLELVAETAGTSGDFQFRFAQNSSGADNATVKKGSYIEYHVVD